MDLGTQTLPHLLDPRLWRYRGEGNANVVLGYVGDDPRYAHHVLRLRKKDPVASPATSNTDRTAEQGILDVAFGLHIVAPLIGAEYVGPVILLEVTPAFLEAVSDSIHPHRPPHRLAKLVHPAQRINKLRSRPAALGLLTRRWYHAGNSVSTSIKDSCLTRIFLPSPHQPSANESTLIVLLSRILLREALLQRLKHLQRTLDALDVEGAYALYVRLVKEGIEIKEPDMGEWREVVRQYEERMRLEGRFESAHLVWYVSIPLVAGSHRSLPLPDPADSTFDPAMALHHLREFLLSVTLKDCSIMIALGRSDSVLDPGVVVIPEELDVARPGRAFVYTMRTIDLDPKPTRNISHYRKLDERIVECFVRGEEGKRCVE
ncbi:hypothetical protein BC938DRAFT_484260 [Jimgerdemannia flammicorona]|uniref:Inositol-pentakisphosphate 2-kinase n=1 Tax=Jimgerdemannia flammicorona TaxID=994334 RepID=A0A433QA72_9FUNG|nr:hypothetical protein BC938DRAFT_484260 [Jimgerdemannia flammicorona]